MTDIPTPGIHPDVHFSEYCKWPLMNGSTMSWGLTSMLHLWGAKTGNLYKKTKALRVGRAMHSRFLEPEEYALLPIATPCEARLGKSSKRWGEPCGKESSYLIGGEWFCGTHAPKKDSERKIARLTESLTNESQKADPNAAEIAVIKESIAAEQELIQPQDFLTVAEASNVEGAFRQVQDHSVIKMFQAKGGVETSLVWNIGDMLMKGRVDKDLPAPRGIHPVTVDLKKVARGRGTDWAFAKAVSEYHYDMKGALYVDGLYECDGIRRKFVWVVVEDEFPHAVNLIEMDRETLEIGRAKYRYVLRKYAECMKKDTWPGYATKIHFGGLTTSQKRHWRTVLGIGR